MVNMDSHNTLSLSGCWPEKESTDTLKLAIRNPELYAEQFITHILNSEKIKWSKKIKWRRRYKTTFGVSGKVSSVRPNLISPGAQEKQRALGILLETHFRDSGKP